MCLTWILGQLTASPQPTAPQGWGHRVLPRLISDALVATGLPLQRSAYYLAACFLLQLWIWALRLHQELRKGPLSRHLTGIGHSSNRPCKLDLGIAMLDGVKLPVCRMRTDNLTVLFASATCHQQAVHRQPYDRVCQAIGNHITLQ
jgi:hypothetical protein